jgi:alkane 1-monooxygenase
MSGATAEVLDRPAVWRDGKRFLWPLALAVPLLPLVCLGIVGKSGHEGWWWLGAVLVFVQVPLMDRMIGSDDGNPPEDLVRALQSDRFYRWMTFLYLPLLFVGLVIGCRQWVTADLGWVGRLGMVVTVGIVSGIAINTAHELGHKIERLERWLSKIALAPSAYGHFYVEHNRGHHIRVATPEDPASARLGEGFWRFWPRVVWGSLRHAVGMEWKRFRRRGQSPWTWRNDVLNAWAMTVALWAGLVVWLGPGVLVFLVAQAVIGLTLLESVNYLEHYGLKRQLTPYGRYENVDARHSWNSDRLATNLFLYQLQRHSDHHANPTRRYQVLRSLDVSPQLPAGYASMIVLSMVPPLWRRVMDHRVVEHYGGDVSLANVHPPARARLERRYGTPPGSTSGTTGDDVSG